MEGDYSLLVSDLDGTLLTNNKQISTRSKQTIKQFQKNGGMFTIATGRSLIESQRFIEELQIMLPIILCNGGMLYFPHEEETQVIKTTPSHVMKALFLNIQSFKPKLGLLLFSSTQIYSFQIGAFKTAELAKLGITTTLIHSLDEVKGEIIKLQLIGSPSTKQYMHAFLESQPFQEEYDFVQSYDYYYEILPKGISKGNALQHLHQLLQVSPMKTAVIGDQCNDISMLQIAGIAASMENAHPLVKECVPLQVPTNAHDGVAYFIENYLLSS